jgi:hypothetical protein
MPYPDSEYPSILRGRDKRESQRLMAAAPELLRELKRLLSMWEQSIGCEKDYMDMGAGARAAIAKAEGRE